ncbi:tetratricopeptide repeat protein, partial [Alienimonas chondri]|uniref:tetratricopeptide repeat protein n=1 Tax=Alienimonas chondri TaxID=2681879 RepID=UPI0014879783
RPAEAAEAFEAALARGPARRNLPDLLTGLGRALSRAGRGEETAAVWDRLEAQFPDDDAVRERIAATLEAEGDAAGAAARYDALANGASDPYRRVALGLKAAGLKSRLGRREEAVAEFDRLAEGLEPDSWLFGEARAGIERAFLRTDDLAGLVEYYERRIERRPEDVAAMVRLGALERRRGRAEPALRWLKAAVAKAPTDPRPRRALAEFLLEEGRFAAAATEFERLAELRPGDSDVFRDWGTALLRDPSRPEAENVARAEAVWRRLLTDREDDPVALSTVADWLRQANAADAAVTLYERAAAADPDNVGRREALGEYLHELGRSEAALEAWTWSATGERRTVRSLARLAIVLANFEYDDRAVAAALEADALDREQAGSDDPAAGELNFTDRLAFAALFAEAGETEAAHAQILKAEALAETAERRRMALAAAVAVDRTAGTLADRIAELERAVADDSENTALPLQLAAYREAAGDLAGANAAAALAVDLAPQSTEAWMTLAGLRERSGRLPEAADALRRLADLDPTRRIDALTRLAGIQLRLGRLEQAQRTARAVVAAGPDNPRALALLAKVALRAGDEETGLDAMRRAARAAPNDPAPLLSLAAELRDRSRTDEAIETLWQAFARADRFEDRGAVVRVLAPLARQQERFEAFLAKLERTARPGARRTGVGRGDAPAREATLLAAEAHLAVDDPKTARATLKTLDSPESRDAELLARLSALAEGSDDLAEAAEYQRRVADLRPQPSERLRLARLLRRAGDNDAADRVYEQTLAAKLEDGDRMQVIEELLVDDQLGVALRVAGQGLRDDPNDWRLLYRIATACGWLGGNPLPAPPTLGIDADSGNVPPRAIATAAMRRILALPRTADVMSADTAPAVGAGSGSALAARTRVADDVGGIFTYYAGAGRGSGATSPLPADLDLARLGATVWLARVDSDFAGQLFEDAGISIEEPLEPEPSLDVAAPDRRAALWDAYFVLTTARLRGYQPAGFTATDPRTKALRLAVAERLVSGPDAGPEAWEAFVQAVSDRRVEASSRSVVPAKVAPLSDERLELLRAALDGLAAAKSPAHAALAGTLMTELQFAGRDAETGARAAALAAAADTPDEIAAALRIASDYGRREDVLRLLAKAAKLAPAQRATVSAALWSLALPLAEARVAGDPDGMFELLDAAAALEDWQSPAPTAPAIVPLSPYGTPLRRIDVRYAAIRDTPPRAEWFDADEDEQFPPPPLRMDPVQRSLLRATVGYLRSPNTLTPLLVGEERKAAAANRGVDAAAADSLAEHLQLRANARRGADRAHELLRLACVRWWTGQSNAARAVMAEALEADPSDWPLRRALADLSVDFGQHQAALALLDAVEPPDADALRHREMLALKAAETAGDLDRVRSAAKRLADLGSGVGAGDRVALARTLQRIGEGDEATALLREIAASSATGTPDLLQTMQLLVSGGEQAHAAEVAREILRRTSPVTQSGAWPFQAQRTRILIPRGSSTLIGTLGPRNLSVSISVDVRSQAARVLHNAGQLAPLVTDLRRRLAADPSNGDLRTRLAGLLLADRAFASQEEARAILAGAAPRTAADFKAEADRLHAAGQATAAADLYVQALRLDPRVLESEAFEIQQLYRGNGKSEALYAALGDTDPADWTNFRNALQFFPNAFHDDQARGPALAALLKIWDRRPEVRSLMLEYVLQEEFYAADPVFDAALTEIVDAAPPLDWATLLDSRVGSFDGPRGQANYLLDAATTRGELPKVIDRLRAAQERHPEWEPGRALLAAALARDGRGDEAEAAAGELLRDLPEEIRGDDAWVLSTLLGATGPGAALALPAQRCAVETGAASNMFGDPYDRSPVRALVDLLAETGAVAEARELLLARALDRDELERRWTRSGREGYLAGARVESWGEISGRLVELGFPLDALRVLDAAESHTETWEHADRASSTRRHFDPVRAAIGHALTPKALSEALEAQDAEAADAGDDAPAVNLFLRVADGGSDPADAVFVSDLLDPLFAEADDGVNDEASDDPAARFAPLQTTLQRLSERRPADASLTAAVALTAFAAGGVEAAVTPVAHLVERAETTTKPTADAVGAWWLTGLEASQHPPTAEAGAALTAAALAGLGGGGMLRRFQA